MGVIVSPACSCKAGPKVTNHSHMLLFHSTTAQQSKRRLSSPSRTAMRPFTYCNGTQHYMACAPLPDQWSANSLRKGAAWRAPVDCAGTITCFMQDCAGSRSRLKSTLTATATACKLLMREASWEAHLQIVQALPLVLVHAAQALQNGCKGGPLLRILLPAVINELPVRRRHVFAVQRRLLPRKDLVHDLHQPHLMLSKQCACPSTYKHPCFTPLVSIRSSFIAQSNMFA